MRSLIKLIALAVIISSCGGKDNPPTPEPVVKELGEFNLVFPDNNLICTEGNDIGNNEVAINFLWAASQNATSYNLEINNLDSNETINMTSTTTSKEVTLSKDAQFSWKVTAILNDKTKESAQWNFYSEGISEENFAPFPAEISITDNGDGTVKIDWPSSDLDDDIESYDFHFGTEPNPSLVFENITYTSISAQAISYNTDYYIKVITKDARGNTSTSSRRFKFSS